MWCFLDAGISRTLALETVNRRLLMKSTEEMFATMDLCILDLNTGVAEFTKFAACRTLILRGRELLQIEGGQLPLGILEGVQPGISRVRLRPGDLLVMGSDGVMEAGDALMIEHLVQKHTTCPPQQLAEILVREAGLRRARDRQDDLTCICLKMEVAG
ncbi:MAG: SpoIIE family protein phosphatase [Clostridia bacterium]|nr:SpoIIE family protein phosphatase [Clostridia bacterium]